MQITSKGQVTIPKDMRDQFGLLPLTNVQFVVSKGQLTIRPQKNTGSRGERMVWHLKNAPKPKMTTDEIMALTRGED